MERKFAKRIMNYYKSLDGEIAFVTQRLKDCEEVHYNQRMTAGYSGTIQGKGGIATPVEQTVLAMSQDEHMEERKTRIIELRRIKYQLEEALNHLSLIHKSILYKFYVRKYNWVKISVQLNYNESHCRRLRDQALDDLGKRIDANESLLNSLKEKI